MFTNQTEPFVHKLDWLNHLQIGMNDLVTNQTEWIIHKSDWTINSQTRLKKSLSNYYQSDQLPEKRKYFNFLKIIHFTSQNEDNAK